MVWQAWRGSARHGMARRGVAGVVWYVGAWQGTSGLGRVRRGRHGLTHRKENTMVYKWKNNNSLGCKAQAAGEVIEQIEKENGEVTKEAFLDASRPEDAPTHPCFEWNDDVAAEKYRLWQSGNVIRNVCVVIEKDDGAKEQIPAFVNVRENYKESASFVNISTVLSNEEQKKIMLSNAETELKAFRNKYAKLNELANVIGSINEYLEG